jgi:hypothetical protein
LTGKKCPICGNFNLRFFDTETTPQKLAIAKQEELEVDKRLGRSCKCIDNGRDFNGRKMTYGQRLSEGFKMLRDFFEP